MQSKSGVLAVMLSIWTAPTAFPASYDVLIRHGRILDGTGSPAYFADVGVRGGRIVAIGKLNGDAKLEIDATGRVVAPGFIDVHTHAENILELPQAENFVRMGVTSVVAGNCGSSESNVAEFFRKAEATGVSVNVAMLIGHGTVREEAMGGSFDRPPTAAELKKMSASVAQAMSDGALGMSTGLIYLPGTFAKTDEIADLAKVVARHGGVYASHMRDEGADIDSALGELLAVARQAGVRAHVSHIKLSGRTAWGRTDRVLAAIDKARAGGLDITQDQYVYTASSTGLGHLIPDWAREGEDGKFAERLDDAAIKSRIVREMKDKLKQGGNEDYAFAVIANCEKDRTLNGKNVVEAARLKRNSDSLDDQIELVLEIQKNGGAAGVFHSMDEADLRRFLGHPNTMFAADSSVRKYQEGVPHPRGYGNNARVLGQYVRELRLLRMEEAVRRMTSLPATVFGIAERGHLREGNWADLVVFDPDKVKDEATFNAPHRYATGFAAVLVNGVVVARDDRHADARPGKPVRIKASP